MTDDAKHKLPKVPPLHDVPLPSVAIGNLDSFLAIVGQWNLYDMEVRALRLAARKADGASVEVDLYLPDHYLRPPTPGEPRTEHLFTFRFSGVSECSLVDFGLQNLIGEYDFAAARHAYSGKPAVRVRIMGTVGCDLDLVCDSVSIASTATLSAEDQPDA